MYPVMSQIIGTLEYTAVSTSQLVCEWYSYLQIHLVPRSKHTPSRL